MAGSFCQLSQIRCREISNSNIFGHREKRPNLWSKLASLIDVSLTSRVNIVSTDGWFTIYTGMGAGAGGTVGLDGDANFSRFITNTGSITFEFDCDLYNCVCSDLRWQPDLLCFHDNDCSSWCCEFFAFPSPYCSGFFFLFISFQFLNLLIITTG